MGTYKAIPPKLVELDPNEKLIHSFKMQTFRRKNVSFLFNMYQPDFMEFFLHLTNKRLIIEPRKPGRFEHLFLQAFLVATVLTVPDAAGAVHAAGKSAKKGEAMGNAQESIVYAIPLSRIRKLEVFQLLGVRPLIRLIITDRPKDEFVFSVGEPDKILDVSYSHPQNFVQLVNEVLSTYNRDQK